MMGTGSVIRKIGMGFELDFQNNVTREVKEVRREMGLMDREIGKSVKAFDSGVDKMELRMTRLKKGLAISAGMMAVGTGMLVGLKRITETGMEADAAWRNVASLLITEDFSMSGALRQVDLYEDRVAELASRIGVPIAEIRESWYALQSAIHESAEAAIEPTLKLAVAARGTSQEAVDVMNKIMKNYRRMFPNLSDAEMAELVFKRVTEAVGAYDLTLSKVARGLPTVIGAGAAAGVDLSELLAFYGELATATGWTERAGSTIERWLAEAANFPDKAAAMAKQKGQKATGTIADMFGGAAQDGLDEGAGRLASINLATPSGHMKSMLEILREFEEALGITADMADEVDKKMESMSAEAAAALDVAAELGITLAERRYMAQLWGEEGGRGFAFWLGKSKNIAEDIKSITAGTHAEDMFEVINEGASSKKVQLENTWDAAKVELSTNLVPVMEDLTDALKTLTAGIRNFWRDNPELAKALTYGGGGVALGLPVAGGAWALWATRLLATLPARLAAAGGAGFFAITSAISGLAIGSFLRYKQIQKLHQAGMSTMDLLGQAVSFAPINPENLRPVKPPVMGFPPPYDDNETQTRAAAPMLVDAERQEFVDRGRELWAEIIGMSAESPLNDGTMALLAKQAQASDATAVRLQEHVDSTRRDRAESRAVVSGVAHADLSAARAQQQVTNHITFNFPVASEETVRKAVDIVKRQTQQAWMLGPNGQM